MLALSRLNHKMRLSLANFPKEIVFKILRSVHRRSLFRSVTRVSHTFRLIVLDILGPDKPVGVMLDIRVFPEKEAAKYDALKRRIGGFPARVQCMPRFEMTEAGRNVVAKVELLVNRKRVAELDFGGQYVGPKTLAVWVNNSLCKPKKLALSKTLAHALYTCAPHCLFPNLECLFICLATSVGVEELVHETLKAVHSLAGPTPTNLKELQVSRPTRIDRDKKGEYLYAIPRIVAQLPTLKTFRFKKHVEWQNLTATARAGQVAMQNTLRELETFSAFAATLTAQYPDLDVMHLFLSRMSHGDFASDECCEAFAVLVANQPARKVVIELCLGDGKAWKDLSDEKTDKIIRELGRSSTRK
ncbi:hypothetical protein M427DRAFT_41234 [Gonapodya prolifera JEL478]|uniref:F-box domain-containing protein n=1 Tax=Gonapodya prolifera (strain JEL478) TaxID=1344416 RepID=A0A139AVD4_GONPJ|nr:hypothetical protein M427DRAFT_41234 [Gonapodya prolifera JEL478]|eukprot:KXS20445.1 hypothetical protein M427DRAFT_41234 [Gonapodya prolifera JEL478]